MKTMISAILFAVALPTAAHAAEDVKKTCCCCKEGAEKMACCEEMKKASEGPVSHESHEAHQGK